MSEHGHDLDDPINAPQRLVDLEASGLLDATAIDALDDLAVAVHTVLGDDTTAAITAITADAQILVSISAEEETPSSASVVPLSHSMCKHVVITGRPYVVDDTAIDPIDALAADDFGIGAYIGFPLRGPEGTVLGAVCAATPGPREWTDRELSILGSIASAAESVVALHAAARSERIARISGAVPTSSSERVQHDLRTPLTAIRGYIELLLEDADEGAFNEDQFNALRRSHANAEKLLKAVEYLRHPASLN